MMMATQTTQPQRRIEAQKGPQRAFLESHADVAIFGGGAGGGKSFALLLEAMRNCHVPSYRAVLFRKTFPQITNPGGMWDESTNIYPFVGAEPRQSELLWKFHSGARVEFAHLQHEKNIYDWQGAQIPLIGFDEVTHFSEQSFFYLLSRNRSTSGVRPYVRATCNPDPDSFVARLIDWWLDEEGYPIPARSGVLRWFVRVRGELDWADTPEALTTRYGVDAMPKSLTFIPALVTDNPALLAANPEYLANLKALPYVEQMRLLRGNWKVRPEAGKVFNRAWFEVVDAAPAGGRVVRFWDFAATEAAQKGDDPDWTVGLRLRRVNGFTFVEDVVRERGAPAEIKRLVKATATQDGYNVAVGFEVEGGSAGKFVQQEIAQLLAGWNVRGVRPVADKVTRAGPVAAQALAGNVKLVRGEWNEPFLRELHGFPDVPHDDQCLAAGTLIATLRGDVPIDQVRSGDYVLTRKGYRRVLAAGMTSVAADVVTARLSDGRTLTGTRSHPVFTRDRGIIALDAIRGYDIISLCKHKTRSPIRTLCFGVIPTQRTQRTETIIVPTRGIFGRGLGIFTRRSGRMLMGRFQRDTRFTIGMETRSTIALTTSSALAMTSISGVTPKWVRGQTAPRSRRIWIAFDRLQKNGMLPLKGTHGTLNTGRKRGKRGSLRFTRAHFAAKSLNRLCAATFTAEVSSFVLDFAANAIALLQVGGSRRSSVRSAARRFLGNPDKKPVPVSVVSVRGVTGKAAVYNLTVEDAHEFFANGVLVHNCDALSGAFTLAMELGDGPAAQAQVVSREQMTQILG